MTARDMFAKLGFIQTINNEETILYQFKNNY
jgi:hypothetical protein